VGCSADRVGETALRVGRPAGWDLEAGSHPGLDQLQAGVFLWATGAWDALGDVRRDAMADAFQVLLDVDAEKLAALVRAALAQAARWRLVDPRLNSAELERWEAPYKRVVGRSGARSCGAEAQQVVKLPAVRAWSELRQLVQGFGRALA
jgi:hypothetical protein